MPNEPIAIVTDSSCDLPQEVLDSYEHLYVLPLRLIYPEGEYRCGVDITSEEVLARMEREEVPTTTLPAPEDVDRVFASLHAKGIRRAVFVMISSGLSGAYNMVRLMCEDHPEVASLVYDTKILSMGLGYMVMNAIELVQAGVAFEEMEAQLGRLRPDVDGFFYVSTLDYLIRGGRIGLVLGTVGKLLNLKPIISVNEEGKYYTKATCIGARRAPGLMKGLVSAFTQGRNFELSVMNGGAAQQAAKLLEELKALPGLIRGQLLPLGPALVVHTGPGMMAVVVRRV